MEKWIVREKATLYKKNYCVTGSQLVEDAWYGDDGMSDYRSTLPLEKYCFRIESWYEGIYGKCAGPASPIRMTSQTITGRDAANKCWKILRDNDFSWDELEFMGFRRN